jgi:hypothetical protein
LISWRLIFSQALIVGIFFSIEMIIEKKFHFKRWLQMKVNYYIYFTCVIAGFILLEIAINTYSNILFQNIFFDQFILSVFVFLVIPIPY